MHALRLATMLVTLALSSPAAQAQAPEPVIYSGTGAWIDRYDFARLEDARAVVGQLAAHGVKTLYVETASWRVPKAVDIVAPQKTADLIAAAHANGMKVVAWYLPGFKDLPTDLRRVRAALSFQTPDGQQFDSFALDIEATEVRSIARRNAALLSLARTIRRDVGPVYELGAIVPDQRSTSAGPVLWPNFPYAATAPYFDVYLPMAYSTFNRARGADGVYRYSARNVRFVRRATGKPVHLIGGIANEMTDAEQAAVARGARAGGAIGVSLYKYALYDTGSWAALRAFDALEPGLPIPVSG